MRRPIARDINQRRRLQDLSVANWVNTVDPNGYGAALWLDASDTSTITSSGSPAKVSQWNDKSINGFHMTQATSAAQPVTGSNTINGLNVLTFDGAKFLSRSSVQILSFLRSGTNAMFFAVGTKFSDNTFWEPFNLDATGGSNRFAFEWRGGSSSNNWYFDVFNTSSGRLNTQTSFPINTPRVVSGFRESSIIRVFSNKSQIGSRTDASGSAVSATGTFQIGRFFSGDPYTDGTFAEIILIPGYSAYVFSTINDYLSRKWAVP